MKRLPIEVEEDYFDALQRCSIANQLNCGLFVLPVFA